MEISFRTGQIEHEIPVTEVNETEFQYDAHQMPTANPTSYAHSTHGGVPASPKSTNTRPKLALADVDSYVDKFIKASATPRMLETT